MDNEAAEEKAFGTVVTGSVDKDHPLSFCLVWLSWLREVTGQNVKTFYILYPYQNFPVAGGEIIPTQGDVWFDPG